MKRTQLNLALLVVAVGLGLAVYFSQEKEEKGPPLTALQSGDLTRIAIEHPGAPAIRLEKRDGGWYFTEPVKAEVDEFEINALLGLATTETRDKVEGGKLAELGLDPPAYTITLNDTAIAFGGIEPLNYRRYVKVGDVVSLIENPPSAALDKDYADLVSKGLFPAGVEIERIELPKLTLAKAEGKWALTPPDPTAGADQMQTLANSWMAARAMWNEAAEDVPATADRVRITLKDGAVREFLIAATEPQFKLNRPDLGVNLVLSKALADQLLNLPEPEPEPEPEPPKQDEQPGETTPAEAAPAEAGE